MVSAQHSYHGRRPRQFLAATTGTHSTRLRKVRRDSYSHVWRTRFEACSRRQRVGGGDEAEEGKSDDLQVWDNHVDSLVVVRRRV